MPFVVAHDAVSHSILVDTKDDGSWLSGLVVRAETPLPAIGTELEAGFRVYQTDHCVDIVTPAWEHNHQSAYLIRVRRPVALPERGVHDVVTAYDAAWAACQQHVEHKRNPPRYRACWFADEGTETVLTTEVMADWSDEALYTAAVTEAERAGWIGTTKHRISREVLIAGLQIGEWVAYA